MTMPASHFLVQSRRPAPVTARHEVTLVDGSFRVVLTKGKRVFVVIAAQTALGPVRIALEVDRSPYMITSTGGLFDFVSDAVDAVGDAAKGAFNAATNAASSVAKPVVDAVKSAAEQAARTVSQVVTSAPRLIASVPKSLGSALTTLSKAKLGDISASSVLRTIGQAAQSGVKAAQAVGDTLLDASKTLAQVADVPVLLTSQIPGLGGIVQSISPLQVYQSMASAIQAGDFDRLKNLAKSQLQTAQGVVSLIPGIGTGVSSAIGTGLALLEGGSPIEIAIRTAYGAIPIPIGIRQITDAVLEAVISLAKGQSITDVALAAARDQVPAGFARDVFDTLAQIVVRRVPVTKAAGAMVEHYVKQYTGDALGRVADLASNALPSLPSVPSFVSPIASSLSSLAPRPVSTPARVVAPSSGLKALSALRVGGLSPAWG